MARVLVPVAEGSEELETVTVIDLLRRAGIEVVSAGIEAGPLTASRGVVLTPDTTLEDALKQNFDMVVLPGGGPGAERLAADGRLVALIQRMSQEGKYTAAICAAPKVLAQAGVLEGKQATSYPGVLASVGGGGAVISENPVVVDGTVITSRGPGTAMDFALQLIEILVDKPTRDDVETALQRP